MSGLLDENGVTVRFSTRSSLVIEGVIALRVSGMKIFCTSSSSKLLVSKNGDRGAVVLLELSASEGVKRLALSCGLSSGVPPRISSSAVIEVSGGCCARVDRSLGGCDDAISG